MSKKLNLGCGEFHKEGYVNVDFYSVTPPDIKHDLSKLPYPFKANTFELIEADHVLEHLGNPFQVLKELHRISINGATWKFRVPHFSRGFTHPEHKSGFDVTLPYYYRKTFMGGYQGIELELRRLKLHWFAQPELKRSVLSAPVFWASYAVGKVISFLANLSPVICSRFWCYWVGGFEEIEFQFTVRK